MKTLWLSRTFHIFILLLFLGGIVFVRTQDYGWCQSLRYMAFDAYNRLYPRAPTDQVVIVDIDERSLSDQNLGQWPWARTDVARLVEKLKKSGARAIVFDIVFAESDRTSPSVLFQKFQSNLEFQRMIDEAMGGALDHDADLAQQIKAAGNVVTGFVWSASENKFHPLPILSRPILMARGMEEFGADLAHAPGVTSNLSILERAAAGNGSFGVSPEIDGIVRQVPLFFRVFDYLAERSVIYPSLAIEGLRVAQDPRLQHKLRALKSSEINYFSPPYLLKTGDYTIPLDRRGKFYVYYASARPERYLSAVDVLGDTIPPERIKDKIVLIGTSAEGLKDIRSTPLNLYIPGVEIHLNILEQVLQGKFLLRPDLIQGAEVIFTAITGLLIILLAPFINVIILGGVVIFTVAGGVYGSVSLFHQGILLDPTYPSLAIFIIFVMSSLLSYLRSESERRAVKQAFGLYVSPEYLSELARNPEQLKLGGDTREVTVMFTDIRGFTGISEQLSPSDLIHLMNDFLTPMSDLVMINRGTIDKYMGDAMMAFWNAPIADPDHARHACHAALSMNAALAPLNERLAQEAAHAGKSPLILRAGIGINSGTGAVGNMGSRQRFAYSVLGDAVNLASRLEGQTKTYGVDILIGPDTARQVPDLAVLELDLLRVKGRQEPVRIYTLLGDTRSDSFIALEAIQREMLGHYRAGQFDQALIAIDRCLPFIEERIAGYYEMMRARIRELMSRPLLVNWDGVYTAAEK